MLDQIVSWLRSETPVVAFTGAGISTESGIPDFRSPGGVWAQNQPVYYDEFLASAEARYEYWRQKALADREFRTSRPNVGHQVLADWERRGRLRAVITQNIDGLHQLAGSREVIELHGTARAVTCLDCGARFDAAPLVDEFRRTDQVPECPACKTGRLKHATISFGQSLEPDVLQSAFALCRAARLVFAIGSSLVVEPAASMPRAAKQNGARLVIINRTKTPLDTIADLVLHDTIGKTLAAIDHELA